MQGELAHVYREAITLTEKQAEAIAHEDWEELTALLMKRDRLIARAEALLFEGAPAEERAEAIALLNQLRLKDEVNQGLVTRKIAAMRGEMQALRKSNVAVSGYLGSMLGATESHFIDHDQ